MSTPRDYLTLTSQESTSIRERFLAESAETLVRASELLGQCLARSGKVLICGNGGSAADAQHMAAEMVGRMLIERRALPAIALTTDSSNLTALSNDYGYEWVFSRQVEALARPEDVLVAISTSGNSPSVLRAAEAAIKRGCPVISLTGGTGGKLASISTLNLNAAGGSNSSRIQETHIFIVHSLVDLLDRFFLKEGNLK
ncbi:MAG: SIS domain-containing protein [Bdellovibrionales bacterium]|nr:SIS domain-containing protein [Bdellovibrionales bacterium]